MRVYLEKLMTEAFEKSASDIHLTVGSYPVMRINGNLQTFGEAQLKQGDTERMAMSLLPEQMWETFSGRGELDFSFGIPGVSRFRINVYKQRSCVSLAIRIIPTSIPSLEDLQLPDVLKQISSKPQGLVLVTGPTGSGKSTTLASMIDYMNRTMEKHIITLEDPIEYLHKHQKCLVDQREVGFDTLNFANGLRSSLRQDPDVILVGEMRDLETIQTAITAAETGHLVLGTLHTSSAPLTIERIIDVFPANQQSQIRIQLASVLVSIVAQRLLPTADKKSRRAALEIMINNAAIGNLIRNEKTHQIANVMQTSRAAGMVTLEMSMKELFSKGIITKETVEPFLQEKVNYYG